jgi:RNA polymerase sigma factor (sigma-70 family)
LARVRDWIEREISFVDNPDFGAPNANARIQRPRPGLVEESVTSATSMPGLAFVSGLVDAPLLTPDEEVTLFTWMNFLKYRAEQSRQRLDLNEPDGSLVDQVEADLREAVSVRNRIVRGNMRLIVALARKLAVNLDQMSELIGEATVPLIRAVELFDVGLGNRFSTYATWAIRNHMFRCLKRQQASRDRTSGIDPLHLDRLPDERTDPEEDALLSIQRVESVRCLLTSLNDRERLVIAARYGLDGEPRGQSLQEIADRVGLSKERVRQIALTAIEKLRGVLTTSGHVS